jgi:predicted alpha/beta-hydrolase family hydrolase
LLKDAAPSVSVVSLVYPYAAGSQRRPPPKAESLLEYHFSKVKEIASVNPDASIVLAGHSMGGRVSVMLAALPSLPSQVRGVICFSYPLVGINRSLRLEPLKACCIPVFMLQGSRDSFFPRSAAALVPPPVTVFAIDGGDHSLCLTKSKLLASFSSSQDVCDRAVILPALTAVFQQLHSLLLREASKRPRPCARL